VTINPTGQKWGRQPTWYAKVGTLSGTTVIIKRARTFEVGQRIEFADLCDLRGTSRNMAPRWRTGYIWKIDDHRLFITL
jgi:hypothetical protein